MEPCVFGYLDDVIIVLPTFEEYVKWLEIVLAALKDANLQINLKKSEFCCAEVKYLGYFVNEDELKTDEDKVKPILEYPALFNIRQLRRFLSTIGWYSRFIAQLAEYKAPLTKLLRKDLSLPSTLQTDASHYATGGVLTRVFEARNILSIL